MNQAAPPPVALDEQRARQSARTALVVQRWGLPIVVGLLLVTLWGLVLIVSGAQKQRLLDDSRDELTQLNSAVAQHTAGLFRDAESDLQIIDQWLQANPGIDPLTDPRLAALAANMRRTSDGMVDPRLVSADGKLFYIPTPGGQPLADVRDRDYYRAQLGSGPRQLYIGEPVISRVTGKWGLPVSWRLQAPVGGMLAVFANIDLTALINLHESMRLKPNGSILLLRTDGVLLSRAPFERSLIGKDVRNAPAFKDEIGAHEAGGYISDGRSSDGVARMVSYQRLKDYPVAVLVNRGLSDVMAEYESRRRTVFTIVGVLTVMAVAFVWFMQRQGEALRRAQRDLVRLEATDSLTGVIARRAFLEIAQREFSRARRYARPVAVLGLDIDHFKRINDTRGHAAGDVVLADCAAAWKKALREQDLLGRIGGEEFCAVLPETPLESAQLVAEKLRSVVAALKFGGQASGLSATVSLGLTMVSVRDDDLAQAMERADRALYLAKEGGRNRVEVLDAEAAPPISAPAASER